MKWLFGFGGATLGVLAGLGVSVVVIYACSATLGVAEDGGMATALALGTVLTGTVGGGVLGAYLGGKAGPPKS